MARAPARRAEPPWVRWAFRVAFLGLLLMVGVVQFASLPLDGLWLVLLMAMATITIGALLAYGLNAFRDLVATFRE